MPLVEAGKRLRIAKGLGETTDASGRRAGGGASERRRWGLLRRLPLLKPKNPSVFEGVEVPLPPVSGRGRWISTPSGHLFVGEGFVRVYPSSSDKAPWGPLQPVVEYPEVQEIFIREERSSGVVHVTAGIAGRRYKVELPRELKVDKLAHRIAIIAGMRLSERNPQSSGEYYGWRVNICWPELTGGWQISAARVVRVEPFVENPLLLARLVTLAAAPSSLVFVGPPGSGKTTALIAVLRKMVELWPSLRVSIVEEEPEVATQVSGPGIISYFSFAGRTVTSNIRATRRYDRPDVLVVGELRGEEVASWFEAAGSGIPVFTTAHSRGLGDAIKRLDTLIQTAGVKGSVVDVVRVWVVCGKVIDSSGEIRRGVVGVHVVTADGFQPVYRGGAHLSENRFIELLPPELQLARKASDSKTVYEEVKRSCFADIDKRASFRDFEPVPIGVIRNLEVL